MDEAVDHYTKIYGQKYNRLIRDSLLWLNAHEPLWQLKLNRDEFIADLISKARVKDHGS